MIEKGLSAMLITTKGRYALRLMIFIARARGQKVPVRRVSEAEGLSSKYLEQLAHALVKAGLLVSVRGYGGGYLLARDPAAIRAGDVLRAAQGSTLPVNCAGLSDACPRENVCSTVAFWTGLDRVIEDYVDGVNLAQLADLDDDDEGSDLGASAARA
ncbi:RrF2 family transcriptional regulator [Berryella wangjianweii]|uniref:RrF2 family transcriptional regulator n=1 Tax=Berryella wangjianweii TaxID=2734634 RepID=UPI0028F6CFDB|nr:Rrf2 family transcriptional regulator [Berryella wangjianweii]